jgi:cytochrome c oxidase subunit 2
VTLSLLALAAHNTAGQFQWLWRIYLSVLVVIAVLVVAAIVFAALRFRRRDRATWPKQTTSAPRLEGVYIVAITLVVIGLLIVTFRTEDQTDALTAHPALRVNVTAFQWQWTFAYPAAGYADTGANVGSARPTFARLIVPVGQPVEFSLRSRDVLHSFFIPALRFKRYAFPNYTNHFVLTFPRTGRFLGECAQFCGWDHAEMRFVVRVLPVSAFRAWLAGHSGNASA